MHKKFSYISLYEYSYKQETLSSVLTCFATQKVLVNDHMGLKKIFSGIQDQLEVLLEIFLVHILWIHILNC